MKRVTRSSFFALYGAFCGIGVGATIAMTIAMIEFVIFRQTDTLMLMRWLTLFCSMAGFMAGMHYSLLRKT